MWYGLRFDDWFVKVIQKNLKTCGVRVLDDFFLGEAFLERKYALEMDRETQSKVNYLSCWDTLARATARWITKREKSITPPKLIGIKFWLHQQNWELSNLILSDFCLFNIRESHDVFDMLKSLEAVWQLGAKFTILTAMVHLYFLFSRFENTFRKCRKVFFLPSKKNGGKVTILAAMDCDYSWLVFKFLFFLIVNFNCKWKMFAYILKKTEN